MTYTSAIDVLLLLIRDSTVLLALRNGTGFADNQWNLPSGKLEAGEDAASALLRETHEEIGLTLDRASLTLSSMVHFRNEHGEGRLGLFFRPRWWDGEPVNAEPHKCARIAWFPLDALPDNTYPYTRIGVDLYQRRRNFAAHGWNT
ncbi:MULTISPECIES: NUDIX domain-containing protein [Protofrankia]|uniref:DNA mismatch repair protein MutT n=1 Tax=Protofrankia coriariae TaxID=1562887 RepID=A0ABR5F1H1_9ACTN|nr:MULTISPECIES: NUDIX domain-containing protein [Protofrankia]KLL10576.1 DNA mismatch repair protein MutT [Protofrankia coriariae]ONH34142.1 DNA mismatch repair protein MutT [Protofrankia sp. BMG5.30]